MLPPHSELDLFIRAFEEALNDSGAPGTYHIATALSTARKAVWDSRSQEQSKPTKGTEDGKVEITRRPLSEY